MEKNMTNRFLAPMILLIVAYEWLIAAFDKLTDLNGFFNGLGKQMSDSISDIQIPFYAQLMKNVGMAHAHLFGSLVVYGELFVGIMFLLSAVMLCSRRMNRTIKNLGMIATVIAAFMSLNYALMGGDGLWIDAGNAFQEAISVDWMLFFFEATFFFYFKSIKPKMAQQATIDQERKSA